MCKYLAQLDLGEGLLELAHSGIQHGILHRQVNVRPYLTTLRLIAWIIDVRTVRYNVYKWLI